MNARHVKTSLNLLLAAAAITGCGGGDEPSEPPSQSTAREGAQAVAATPHQPVSRPPPPASSASSTSHVETHTPDDAAITKQVKFAFLADGEIKRTNLTVDTRKGVVTLGGTVGSQDYVDRAVTIARGTDGVTDVRSQVAVTLHVPTRMR